MVATQAVQKVVLVNNEFSPTEGLNMIQTLIGERINAHKIKRLHASIGSENHDIRELNRSIKGLAEEKEALKQIVDEARISGGKVTIKATLEVCIA